jgi:hypothetical protein
MENRLCMDGLLLYRIGLLLIAGAGLVAGWLITARIIRESWERWAVLMLLYSVWIALTSWSDMSRFSPAGWLDGAYCLLRVGLFSIALAGLIKVMAAIARKPAL